MKKQMIKNSLLVMVFLTSLTVYAGEAKITWQDPQNYTDIASNYGSQSNFQKSLFKTLDAKLSEQASHFPEGNTLEVTITNFDMAGQMRTGPKGGYQRAVQNSQFPQMTLSYKLMDASGTVVAEQQGLIFKDINFYNLTNAVRQTEVNESFFYEGEMINKWFGNTFQLADLQQ